MRHHRRNVQILITARQIDQVSAQTRRLISKRALANEPYKSLTSDNGKELADHQRFTMETDIAVYFCDPHSPSQRGSNEETNQAAAPILSGQ